MNTSDKVIVGIALGDTNGIGIEVVLKTLEDKRILEFFTPVLFGTNRVISYHKKALNLSNIINGISSFEKLIHGKINLMSVLREDIPITLGTPTRASGQFALKSLNAAVEALKKGDINTLVTAPISKSNMQSEEFSFPGHTEYLASHLAGKSLMILVSDTLRVGLITGHIPISKVATSITKAIIEEKVELMYQALKVDFNIAKPKIAVLGLNPHCGDNGLIGTEEEQIIRPAILEIKNSGKLVYGPYAADGFFGAGTYRQFDGILAMYHDQGLAPFKALSFGEGVNFTAGLSKIRTSPDHGTGFDIAGKGLANPTSFKTALFTSIAIFENRKLYQNLTQNALKKRVTT